MTVIHADCLVAMATMDDCSVDAVVTDPPYGIAFMGRDWDHGVPGEPFWAEMLRVAKPGTHLLAFGGTRTVHRLMTAIEDSGWEIRDLLCWAYASGMPKDGDMALDIDRRECPLPDGHRRPSGRLREGEHVCVRSAAGDPFRDWSTTLKPAWEPIVLARKALRGSVVANAERYGTGALNIGATRIPIDPADPINEAEWVVAPSAIRDETAGFVTSNTPGQRFGTKPRKPGGGASGSSGFAGGYEKGDGFVESDVGRWPANVVLSDPVFDGQYPESVVGGGMQSGGGNPAWRSDEAAAKTYHGFETGDAAGYTTGKTPVDTSGTYSRFFLVPKANTADREPILPLRGNTSSVRVNTHTTVKPLALMEHLVRLVTPTGGLVLDPFAGSGTTAIAAEGLGFRWVAIEKEADHVLIIRARLLGRQRGLGL